MLIAAVLTTSTYAGGLKSNGSSVELSALFVFVCFVYKPRLASEAGDDGGVSKSTKLVLGQQNAEHPQPKKRIIQAKAVSAIIMLYL